MYSTLSRTALGAALALLFAACSGAAGVRKVTESGPGTAQTNQSQAAAVSPTASVGQSSTVAALQAVVQRANDEQQQALSQDNPRLMQDTATQSYYQQMAQTNSDLVSGGVTAIRLVKLAWGPASVTGTQAQLTTTETWDTTMADGSTDEATDRNIYTLVEQSGAWKIQADVHPDSGLNQPAPSGPAAPSPSGQPNPSSGGVPGGQGQSENWSGYAADGGNFTAVSGTWTIPTAQANGSQGADATWVGIGGVDSHDLIQAGTETTVSASGSTQDQAWIETLPQASRPVALTVRPGDSMTVSIAQQSPGQWLVSLKDNTTGQSYHTTEQYDSTNSSAEWIEEAPSGARRQAPLDDFGTVSFSNASATKDGKTVNLAQAGAQPITMTSVYGQPLATPSALSSDGKGFSVSRTSGGSSPQGAPSTGGIGGLGGVGVPRSRSGSRSGFAP